MRLCIWLTQLSSALYNAVNHLGPADPHTGAPAPGPAAAALAAQSAGGRRLLQAGSNEYSLSYALAPAPGPAAPAAADAALAPLSADSLSAAASPDADLYTSYAKKKKKKPAGTAEAAAGSSAAGGTVTSVNGAATNVAPKQLSASAPVRDCPLLNFLLCAIVLCCAVPHSMVVVDRGGS